MTYLQPNSTTHLQTTVYKVFFILAISQCKNITLTLCVNHLFYECSFTNLICNEFASFWSPVSGKRVDRTLQDVLLRRLDAEIEILNYFITLVKLHIWITLRLRN